MANWNQVVIDLDNAILHEEKIIQRANEFIIVFNNTRFESKQVLQELKNTKKSVTCKKRFISEHGLKKMQMNGARTAAINSIRREFLENAKLEW